MDDGTTSVSSWLMINYIVSSNSGVENKDDIQHLDHEIKELNESNMKIEADMMQLQTQVSIYSHKFISRTTAWARRSLNLMRPFSPFVPESRFHLWNVTWRQLKRRTRWSNSTMTAFWKSSPALAKLSLTASQTSSCLKWYRKPWPQTPLQLIISNLFWKKSHFL